MNQPIYCIIPARKGSKRFPGKNIRPFLGKPLITWTIEEAMKSTYIGNITVSTDDETVMEIADSYGIPVLRRPQILAGDDTSTIDVVLHYIDYLRDRGENMKHIMLLQPTSPLRTAKHIDEAASLYLSNIGSIDSLISVTKSEHPPWWTKKIEDNGVLKDVFEYDKLKLRRSQDFPETYMVNGAIYIAKTDSFISHRGFETGRTISYIMDNSQSVDIDTEFQLKLAEFIYENS